MDPGGHDWAQPALGEVKSNETQSIPTVWCFPGLYGRSSSFLLSWPGPHCPHTQMCHYTVPHSESGCGGREVGMWLSSHCCLRDLTVSHSVWNRVLSNRVHCVHMYRRKWVSKCFCTVTVVDPSLSLLPCAELLRRFLELVKNTCRLKRQGFHAYGA